MKKQPILFTLLFAGIVLAFILMMQPLQIYLTGSIPVLFAKGIIAREERNLLLIIQVLMLFVVIPVYILTFVFSWLYNVSNTKSYDPNLNDSVLAECIWWGLPCVLIAIIGLLTWVKTYELDPYKPIASDKEPVHIQVVALQWKWLFLYPDEGIATVNHLRIPEKTPINFEITADAPMNSFWIPALAGQIYAMPSMRTKLHLMADEAGDYRGSSANISGEGFADMHFIAKATSEAHYKEWLEEAKKSTTMLDYQQLVHPSQNNGVATFKLDDEKLFDNIIMKYMHPQPMKE